MATIAIRNRRVYVGFSDPDWSEPRIISSFYPTNGDPAVVVDGAEVHPWNGLYMYHGEVRDIPLTLTDTRPEFTEFTPIPPAPGRTWRNGAWARY